MPLQHVLANRKPFILHPGFTWLFGDNLQSRKILQCIIESFISVLVRSRSQLSLENADFPFAAGQFANKLSQSLRRRYAVGCDKSVARSIGWCAIDAHYWNIRSLGRLHRHPGGSGSGRNIDERFDANG